MAKTTNETKPAAAPKARDRRGAVMVDLSPAERQKLERIAARMQADTGVRVGLATVFRAWLRKAEES
jgi:hypothetical protein